MLGYEQVEKSVVYREGPLTVEDYDEAIEDLKNGREQLLSLERGEYQPACRVCEDTGHLHCSCHHNPLVVARLAARRGLVP